MKTWRVWCSIAALIVTPTQAGAQGARDSSVVPERALRSAWLSDRVPLRVGDVITVRVEEQTSAREQVSQVATGQRNQKATLDASLDAEVVFGASRIQSGVDGQSRDAGEARRRGDLGGIISVQVTELTPAGLARVNGRREVVVDGRRQEMTLTGLVRPEDVSASNVVHSSRLADAVITYKGKKMSPRTGLMGRLLGMLWP